MSEIATQTVTEPATHVGAKRAPRVLLSPYTNTTNPYIELQKALLTDIGYDVRPMSLKSLAQGGFVDVFRPGTVLVFHWLELRAFNCLGKEVVLSPRGLLVFAFYCLLMRVGRARTVYFVHDHAVHNTRGKVRRLSMRLMSIVRRLADFRVVHAPDFEAQYDARYLPHPLYWDVPERTPDEPRQRRKRAKPAFALLGAIQPYKEIAAVLQVWPRDSELEIAGRSNPAYVETLDAIVRERALGDVVTIDARLLSDEEFEQKVEAADVVILPHAADSMLVSGAFFEAIGRVPFVISRAIPFMKWAAQQFDNVLLFDNVDELPALVESVARRWAALESEEGGGSREQHRAIDAFGWNACRRRYQQFFGDIVGVPAKR
ncbi:MAG TPA: glycosyltransferase [Paraburkholderia sp.]|nr:glycosyltransferase [Paraburkholderia sp.]